MSTQRKNKGKNAGKAAQKKPASPRDAREEAVEPRPAPPVSSRREKRKERALYAAVLALVLAVPLLVMLGTSIADGFVRSGQAPLRAILGNARYEELVGGQGGVPHYLGYSRLAPDFELRDRHGETWRLSDHRGHVVVMNFWSITCAPCIEEMPSVELLDEMAERRWDDVEVVAVSTDAGWDTVRTVLPEDPGLTHLFDPDKSVVQGMFGTALYPETWIIDADGVIRFRYDGARDWSTALVLDLIELFR